MQGRARKPVLVQGHRRSSATIRNSARPDGGSSGLVLARSFGVLARFPVTSIGAVDECQNSIVRSQGAAGAERPERPTRPVKADWSPPSSPWMLKDQQAVVGSKLSLFEGGLLIWEPVGLSPKEPGGAPFQLQVGPLPGQVQELVWVYGTVAAGRGGAAGAAALALCTPDPASPGGRRVLAYLPAALLVLALGNDVADDEARARARAEKIANTLGVRFSVHEVAYAENPNVMFPGVMRYAGVSRGLAWIQGPIVGGMGLALVVVGLSGAIRQDYWAGLIGVAVGLMCIGVGVLALPPVTKRYRKRSSTQHARQ